RTGTPPPTQRPCQSLPRGRQTGETSAVCHAAAAGPNAREGGHEMTIVRTSLCPLLGIEHPIVGFSPSEHVAAAISRAGGLGVLGCVRFNDPADLDTVLDWMDQNTGGRPYGIDVVMPARVPAEGGQQDLSQLIPQTHQDFVEQTLLRLGV